MQIKACFSWSSWRRLRLLAAHQLRPLLGWRLRLLDLRPGSPRQLLLRQLRLRPASPADRRARCSLHVLGVQKSFFFTIKNIFGTPNIFDMN